MLGENVYSEAMMPYDVENARKNKGSADNLPPPSPPPKRHDSGRQTSSDMASTLKIHPLPGNQCKSKTITNAESRFESTKEPNLMSPLFTKYTYSFNDPSEEVLSYLMGQVVTEAVEHVNSVSLFS